MNNPMRRNIILTPLLYQTIIWGMLSSIFYIISFKLLDLPIANFFHIHHRQSLSMLCQIIALIFDPDIWIIVMVFCGLIALYQLVFKKQSQNTAWLKIALSLFIAAAVATLLKFVIGRYRPIMYFEHGLYGFHHFSTKGSQHSSPSGHAAMAFSGLLAIASCFRKRAWTIFAVILATLICLSRLIITKHYLADVMLGAYIGIFSYFWGSHFIEIFANYWHSKIRK